MLYGRREQVSGPGATRRRPRRVFFDDALDEGKPSVAGTKTTAIYCRASADSDASLSRQETLGTAFASVRSEIPSVYMDIEDSYSIERPGLSRLRTDIERGRISAVWVSDLTRISRVPANLASFCAFVAFHNVEMVTGCGAEKMPTVLRDCLIRERWMRAGGGCEECIESLTTPATTLTGDWSTAAKATSE